MISLVDSANLAIEIVFVDSKGSAAVEVVLLRKAYNFL